MRRKTATAIKNAIEADYSASTPKTPFFNFRPIPDDVMELTDLEGARKNGNIAKVPILPGTNAREGALFSIPYNSSDSSGLKAFVNKNISKGNVDDIVAAYPVPETYADSDAAVAACWTEYVYQCVRIPSPRSPPFNPLPPPQSLHSRTSPGT
jgi:carboxylesterase type B